MDVPAKQILAAKKLAKRELSTEPKLAAEQVRAAKSLITAEQRIAEATEAALGRPLTAEELKQIDSLFEERPKVSSNVKIASKTVLAALNLVKQELSSDQKLAAEQIAAAKSLLAAVDTAEAAAEKRGYPRTDEELIQLGYEELEGNVWGIPISESIWHVLYEEERQKNNG
jgi:hypothetical protein